MINTASYIHAVGTLPYENLALEELLLGAVKRDEVVLYLWQNRNTVVIGRNQNAYRECKVDELLTNGGHLARRLSGGGAVFHDMGNLNFTFVIHKDDYNVDKQLEVILRAVRSFGVPAEKSGRNDLTAGEENGKFSGNAFYKKGEFWYHHGTILVNADLDNLSRYLTVSKDKLKANGVESVRSRVVNLSELCADITILSMRAALIKAFGEVYEAAPASFDQERINEDSWETLLEKFMSKRWLFGSEPDSTAVINHRFSWGGLELHLTVSGGIIKETATYTDALDTDIPEFLQRALQNAEFTKEGVTRAFTSFLCDDAEECNMLSEIAQQIDTWFNR